jgi:hypothetical protein
MIRKGLLFRLIVCAGFATAAIAQDVTTTTTTTTTSDGTTVTDVQQGPNAGSSTTTTHSSGTEHSESTSESSGSGVSVILAVPTARAPAPRASGGNSCSVPANHQCRGCAVSCPSDKQASCTPGDRGIFTGENDGLCPTDAKCVCK